MKFLCFFLCFYSAVSAQQVYWVSFTQKDAHFSTDKPQQFLSDKAIQRRQKFQVALNETDLPVSAIYLDELGKNGFTVLSVSKWLNAAAVLVPLKTDLNKLQQFSFVKTALSLGKYTPAPQTGKNRLAINEWLTYMESQKATSPKIPDGNFYGKSRNQVFMLGTQTLHERGYKGEGIDIAVIDAGFKLADTLPVFNRLRAENRIRATVDFVNHNSDVFDDDDHGLAVLSCMAGYMPNEYIGTAPMAGYYLLRTEIVQSEMPIEEVYWIAAIEYADSVGADLVNSSLGYNEFDDITFNHTYKNLNGKTTLISKAASMAVQKGMVVVVSAGNDGDDDWKFISVPADAEDVITVGGVDATGDYAGFSSIGTSRSKQIKPDIMAQGDNVWVASTRGIFYPGDGTSYSSPIMAGSIACLMQGFPSKTPAQLMNVLHTSGNYYDKPDNYMGYGVPDIQLAFLLLQEDTADAVLDVRMLNDEQIHIAYYSVAPQKIGIRVMNDLGVEVLSETITAKKSGSNRVSLKKIQHFKKGTYSLHWISQTKTTTLMFNNL
jgi:serine protease AprX